MPTQNASSNPDAAETADAIGTRSVIVPTEVPIATETKQATTNNTATAYLAGIKESIQYATLSALPLPTTPTNERWGRRQKDQQHRDDVFITHAARHDLQSDPCRSCRTSSSYPASGGSPRKALPWRIHFRLSGSQL